MKLLYLTAETFPTFRADVRVLFGKELLRQGISVDLVAVQTDLDAPPWAGGRFRGWRRAQSRLVAKAQRWLIDFVAFGALIRGGYGALVLRDKPFLGLVSLLACKLSGVPFVYWISFPMSESALEMSRMSSAYGRFRRFLFSLRGHVSSLTLYRILFPCAKHIFVQSDEMKRWLAAKGVPSGKMTPVPMGVDFEALPDIKVPIEDGRLEGKQVIAYLGTMERVRRVDILIEVVARVRERYPDVLLLLVGDASEASDRAYLKSEIERLGVADSVVWTGWIPGADAWRYLARAQIGLSPFPRTETLETASPTKVVEYVALGLPVVCNDQPDQREVIERTGAGLCVELSADAFTAAVIEMLGDLPKWQAAAARGPETLQTYRSYRAIGQRVAEAFKEIAKPHSRGSNDTLSH